MTALASAPATEFENNQALRLCKYVYSRKNWMFVGSEHAGRRTAAIQSLFATAKLNGIDPVVWLKMMLDKLPTCTQSEIDSLLPFRTTS